MRPDSKPSTPPIRRRWLVPLLGALLAVAAAAMAAESRQVQLRETPLRAAPGPFAEVRAKLEYGAQVVVVEEDDGWTRVRSEATGVAGWLRGSALTEREIALEAGAEDAQVEASDEEIATAAKGFNEQVERKYQQDKDVDYTWVDRMEGFEVADDDRAQFLQRGNLDAP